MNRLHQIEALLLVPLALIHCLLLRLDRLLWHSPAPATPCPTDQMPAAVRPRRNSSSAASFTERNPSALRKASSSALMPIGARTMRCSR